jgi:hypothetical protein
MICEISKYPLLRNDRLTDDDISKERAFVTHQPGKGKVTNCFLRDPQEATIEVSPAQIVMLISCLLRLFVNKTYKFVMMLH